MTQDEIKDIDDLKEKIQDAVAEYCYDCNDNGCYEIVVKINIDYGSVFPIEVLTIRNTE